MRPFAARFPVLFHVADRAALPSIRRFGLLCAAGLCDRHAVGPDRRTALLEQNRTAYAVLGSGAALRWQGMPDGPLSRRLAPGLDPSGWRRLINGKVFLFARRTHAERLRAWEAGRDQVVLSFETEQLIAEGLDLRACRYNNGYLDRRSLRDPRLRGPGDYIPVADWGTGVPSEVTVEMTIPPAVPFRCEPSHA